MWRLAIGETCFPNDERAELPVEALEQSAREKEKRKKKKKNEKEVAGKKKTGGERQRDDTAYRPHGGS